MNTQNVLKVLYRSNSGLQSYLQSDLPAEYKLTYPIDGTIITPNKGFIFTFKDLASVERFQRDSVREWALVEVWEAEAQNPRPMNFLLTVSNLVGFELNSFWSNVEASSKTKEAPQGTLICDSLKLIKKVV